MEADCDSYFVTTYIQIETTWREKEKKKIKQKWKMSIEYYK